VLIYFLSIILDIDSKAILLKEFNLLSIPGAHTVQWRKAKELHMGFHEASCLFSILFAPIERILRLELVLSHEHYRNECLLDEIFIIGENFVLSLYSSQHLNP
jgi:hypothetical protein